MNPTKTLDLVKNHIAAGDIAGATTGIFDYLHWRIRGGYEPRCIIPFKKSFSGDALAADLGVQLLELIAKLERDSRKLSEACIALQAKVMGVEPISREERDFLWEG